MRGDFTQSSTRVSSSRKFLTPMATETAHVKKAGTALSPTMRWSRQGEPSRCTAANNTRRMTDGYGGAGALLPPLTARLPGLASALDSELTALYIERTLLRLGGQVERAIPGALWYHPDGSCSLHYRGTVSGEPLGVTEHTVMARCIRPTSGRSFAHERKGELTPPADPPDPWRRWTAMPEAGGPSLSLFPADPALPTLASAMNLAALSRKTGPCPAADPTSVDLVHHGRQGAAVLRYGVRRTGSSPAPAFGYVYGKSIRTVRRASGYTAS